MVLWEKGKELLWDVTVVDALAPSRLNQGPLFNPGTTATEVEARKYEKCRELIHNEYIFNAVAMEVRGSLGERSEIISSASHVLVKGPVVRTTNNQLSEMPLKKMFTYIHFFCETVYHCSFLKLVSNCRKC